MEPILTLAHRPQLTAGVRKPILVLSGKGGVGKSTFSTVLAYALATGNPECNVALMDLDICGPSVPRMTGSTGESIHASNSGWYVLIVVRFPRPLNLCLLIHTSTNDGCISRLLC